MIKSFIILLVSFLSTPADHKPACDNIVHIGDSTSLAIQDSLRQEYSKSTYGNIIVDASNGRSVYYDSQINGFTGLDSVKHYKKYLVGSICWVIALGTNDASAAEKDEQLLRFTDMMQAIDRDPVIWVNVWMDSSSRPEYNKEDAANWNMMLYEKQQIYNNMYVLNWAKLAQENPDWYNGDHIHYNSEGSKHRSLMIGSLANLYFTIRKD